MIYRVLALIGLFIAIQEYLYSYELNTPPQEGFRLPPPALHHSHGNIAVDHRPPPMFARPQVSRVQLDQGDKEYISHEVSDPDVGESGITALKDIELGACFLYRYMKPLVIPRVQRHFYTRTKTATILLTPRDRKHFKQSVGPAIDNLCSKVRSYWLDEKMFYLYMTNRLHPRNSPPPSMGVNDDDGDMSAALIYPTPPPLEPQPDSEAKAIPEQEVEHHEMKVPPGLAHHEMKVPPGLAHHVMKVPPGLAHHDMKVPAGFAHHEMKIPPGLAQHEMKLPPGLAHHGMKVPPPPPENE